MDITDVLEEHKARIESQWAKALGRASDENEAAAVDAYYIGTADGYNALREQIIERSPEVEKALPPAIDTYETSTRIRDDLWRERELSESQDVSISVQ